MNSSETSSGSAERQLFLRALEKPVGKERTAFLDGACADNPALRRRLEALLQKFETLGTFLQEPAVSLRESRQPQASTIEIKETAPAGLLTEKAGDRIGRYKLLQQIGEGGCGVVYMAEQEEPVRRRVALKVIRLGMDTKNVIARFEAERQALALMDHPNIARVLDAGATETGRPYFVMELVRGIRITDYCDQNRLPTTQRLELFIQICRAIQHAHQKGIIHRDIKPSNILVTIHDGIPLPKVIDFGIAKATTDQRLTDKTLFTQFEQFIGTPAYMSPEQAEMGGLDIDTRSDIYSLGVLLYELLTSKTPFDSEELLAAGLDEMRRTIREKEPVRPSTRLSTMLEGELTTTAKRRACEAPKLIHALRGDLDWIVMKCLEKDRTRRYETANGLAMDLRRHLDHEAVTARPPSQLYRFQRMVHRHRLVFAAATAIVTALLLGIVVSTWQAVRAERARKQAQAKEKEAQRAQASEVEQRRRAESAESATRQSLYAAEMNLAQQAWEQNNVGRVSQSLEASATSQERGFEWYYWQRQTHLELKTLRGHTRELMSVAFSPDGMRIVTGSVDGTAKVWEAASGKELLTLKGGHWITAVAFSPNGQRIVTSSADQTATVWGAASGEKLLTLRGHRAPVGAVAFSPDGQWIATGSADKTARVWEADNGKPVLTLIGNNDWVVSVAFSADGRRLVTRARNGTAKIWEVKSGKELFALEGNSGQVFFSPDGRKLLTFGQSGEARMLDADSGKELLAFTTHSGDDFSMALSPDGQRIVSGALDGLARLWDTTTDKPPLLTLKGHTSTIRSVAFSPDGLRIVTASLDGTAKVWQATSSETLTLKEPSCGVFAVAFSPDGQRIATGIGVFSDTMSPDGRWSVTGTQQGMAKLWDTASREDRLTVANASGPIRSVGFSPDGQRIATCSWDHTARVWEAANGKELFSLEGHNYMVTSVGFSPDGLKIVTGSQDRTAKVWDATNGKLLLTLQGHRDGVWSVAFSPDSSRIVTGSLDGTAKVWEVLSGRGLVTLKGHADGIRSAAFSPDGTKLVTGSLDGTAKLWEAVSGKELLTLAGHRDKVLAVAFSPDGRRIVTASHDATAKVWDAANGKELLTLRGHGEQVSSVTFSPDGLKIVTGSLDGTAKVWQAATDRQVAAWRKEEREAALRLDALRREEGADTEKAARLRAEDPGAIKEWLVLAPIAFEGRDGEAAKEQLNHEQIPGEASARPHAGRRVNVGKAERVWNPVKLPDYLIDFNRLLGEDTQWSLAYAVSYLQSEAEHSGLLVKVGSDDEAKVWLNGKEIYRHETVRTWVADQDTVTGVELRAGLNVLVFKVVNETGPWQGSVRFTDAAGQPLKGIQVTLTPP
jgi:WD40 repeat protein